MACPSGFNYIIVKTSSKCEQCREILFKPNQTKKEDSKKPRDRTLLLINIPPYCSREWLMKIFARFGTIESLILECKLGGVAGDEKQVALVNDLTQADLDYFPRERPGGFHYAFIVYAESSSIRLAMRYKASDSQILSSDVGMTKWLKSYIKQYPDKEKLQENVDAFMAKYDKAVERAEEEEDAGEEDEDGWIKVTRKGKTPVIPRTEANQLKARAKEKARKKKRELLNAYSYQLRESKRQKIAELRQKFEEDKRRIEEMKDARKFKPF